MYGAMTTVMKKWYSQRDSPMIKELARENAFVAPHDSPSPFAFAYDGSEEFYMQQYGINLQPIPGLDVVLRYPQLTRVRANRVCGKDGTVSLHLNLGNARNCYLKDTFTNEVSFLNFSDDLTSLVKGCDCYTQYIYDRDAHSYSTVGPILFVRASTRNEELTYE